MKKLLAFLSIILLMPFNSYATNWEAANQVTLQWDAVTTNTDGSEIDLTNAVLSYEIFAAPMGVKEEAISIANTENTELEIQYNSDGAWLYGLQAIKTTTYTINGETISSVIKSEPISWSDDPEVCKDGNTFGVIFTQIPASVKGLMR